MKICLLCKKAPATQLNSHIIPWGLIKESISINEQKKEGMILLIQFQHLRPLTYFMAEM